ncbi:MAG: hypothetical protein AAF125_22405, partial [Chloroflexota bacterium]
RVLKPNGIFYMDDFVGPSRFQWSDEMLDLGTAVRQCLAEEYLANPYQPGAKLPRQVRRPNMDTMIATDPSEAADSDNILGAVRQFFPDADIMLTGGVVYNLALADILNNFSLTPVEPLLRVLMLLDFQAADHGLTHYAVALATKPNTML